MNPSEIRRFLEYEYEGERVLEVRTEMVLTAEPGKVDVTSVRFDPEEKTLSFDVFVPIETIGMTILVGEHGAQSIARTPPPGCPGCCLVSDFTTVDGVVRVRPLGEAKTCRVHGCSVCGEVMLADTEGWKLRLCIEHWCEAGEPATEELYVAWKMKHDHLR